MAKPREKIDLLNVSRQGFTATASDAGGFSNELILLSAAMRQADALERGVKLLSDLSNRQATLEREVKTLRASVARLRKEVRNA